MKKAVTLIELVFVIVIIGIVSAVIVPRFNRSTLHEAADQIISHIRYTQHLALMDDRFDEKDPDWYQSRWQIFFARTHGSDLHWAYTVFSDRAGGHTGTPDISEIARNPLDPANTFLTGGYSAGTIPYYKDADPDNGIDPRVTKEMNVGHKYGITNISFSGCGGNSRRIAFDHSGRPLIGNSTNLDSLYTGTAAPAGSHLLQQECRITLSDDQGKTVTLAIEPETGYAHIL